MIKKIVYGIIALVAQCVLAAGAQAADFSIVPEAISSGLGRDIEVQVYVNSDGKAINAAQAHITFPPNILEVKSLSKEGSVFNFWLTEPKFSNTKGTIEFTGGTPNGVSGEALSVVKIIFTAKGIGSGNVIFADAAIAAADGSGSNILAKANGTKVTVTSDTSAPVGTAVPVVPPPVKITRAPVAASGLPVAPRINIPLYPQQSGWYSRVAQFAADWDLPLDISDISTAINGNPNFIPPEISEGLFKNKTLAAINKDGVSYFHVRFKNNKGWGPAAHYRIAIDTKPPTPFKIDVKTGLISNNPSPKLDFSTADALSGIDRYEGIVNNEESIALSGSSYVMPAQIPGDYIIKVRAFDKANNFIEDSVKIQIIPIESPSITSISKKVVLGTNDVFTVKGINQAGSDTIITIEDTSKFLVLEDVVKTNPQGEWELRLNRDLRRGDYYVTIKARDARGALSLPTEPIKVSVVDKPIITLFGLSITLTGLIIILLAVGIAIAGYVWRKTLIRIARFQRGAIIISRDLENTFVMVKKDLDRLTKIAKADASVDAKDLELKTITKKITESLDKISSYLNKDIEQLK